MRKLLILIGLLVSLSTPLFAAKIVEGTVNVDAAGTAEQLSTTSQPCAHLVVMGAEGNTDIVTVGSSSVDATQASRKGLSLFPGQIEIFPGRHNLVNVFADVEVNDEDLEWLCIQ